MLHPFLHDYFSKGMFSRQWQWYVKYKTWVKLVGDNSLGITEFKFLTKTGEEIEVTAGT